MQMDGQCPSLLLIHGWGINQKVFQPMAARLEKYFTVYIADLPGYGASANIYPYTLDGIVDGLASRIAGDVFVLGWSLGASVALKFAQRYPNKVKRLLLIAATPSFVQRPGWPHAVEARVLQDFAGDLQQDYAATLKRFFALQALGSQASHEVISQLKACLVPAPATEVLQAGLNLLLTTDLRAELAAITQPTFIIHGKQDKLVPWQAAEKLAGNLENAQFFNIAKAGHAPFVSHPDEVTKVLKEFAGVL